MKPPNFLLYPGCLTLYRFPEYETATRELLQTLGVRVEGFPRPVCCGSSVADSMGAEDPLAGSAYILAEAEKRGLDILTLCGGCTNTIKRAGEALAQDEQRRAKVNQRLNQLGLTLGSGRRVYHLLEVLLEYLPDLSDRVIHPVGYRVALTYPCQVFRPGAIMGFDDPWQPQSMQRLVEAVGAKVFHYPEQYECCGSTLLMVDPSLALAQGQRKLEGAQGADFLVDACGNCHLLLERLQNLIFEGEPRVPVVFLPQYLGAALGLWPFYETYKTKVVLKKEDFRLAKKSTISGNAGDYCRECTLCRSVCPVEQLGSRAMPSFFTGVPTSPWLCTSCWKCQEVCPQGRPIQRTMTRWRQRVAPPDGYRAVWANMQDFGFAFPLDDCWNEDRLEMGLEPVVLPDKCLVQSLWCRQPNG